MDKATNVNKGLCQHRLQVGKPPYFVNYTDSKGKNQYVFFELPFSMYQFYERLKK